MTRSRQHGVFLLGLLATVAGLAYLTTTDKHTKLSTSRPSPASIPITTSLIKPTANMPATAPDLASALKDSSLAGSSIDRVQLSSDNTGKIILNGGILIYFDYFLSLSGEMPLSQIKALIQQDMHTSFPVHLAEQLYTLFERYVAYLSAIDAEISTITHEMAKTQGITEQSLSRRTQSQFFSPAEIDALFGDYERMLNFKSRAASFQEKFESYRRTEQKHAAAMATELFGAEAASRFQQLGHQRQQWQQRLAAYHEERQQILQSVGMTENDKQRNIDDLLKRSFSRHEQVRVKVLEKQTGG